MTRPLFSTITGADFRRSIAASKKLRNPIADQIRAMFSSAPIEFTASAAKDCDALAEAAEREYLSDFHPVACAGTIANTVAAPANADAVLEAEKQSAMEYRPSRLTAKGHCGGVDSLAGQTSVENQRCGDCAFHGAGAGPHSVSK
jgi:hypothetical protein